MAKIQRVPQGLLSLFGAKTVGKNPEDYPDTIQFTYDASEHYQTPLEFTQVSDNTVTAVGSFALVTVPNDEAWLVKTIGSFIGLLAGTVTGVAFAPRIIFAGTTVQTAWASSVESANLTFLSNVVQRDVLLPPGTVIHTHIQRLAATTPTLAVNTQVTFKRLGV